jgi:hypothetical protein
MGLLDDAIREHLELKRRHGADPAEVEAQEREVLGADRRPAVEPADPAAAGELAEPVEPPVADAPLADVAPIPDAPPADEIPLVPDVPPEASPDDALPPTDPFLDEPQAPPDAPPPPAPEAAGAVTTERFSPEPDLDWSDPAPLDAEPEAAAEGEPESEDVLEETPEFLEETPEHDRLWFEQRPPKDFDF